MHGLTIASTLGVAASALCGCADAPVAPNRQLVTNIDQEPRGGLSAARSGEWSPPHSLGAAFNSSTTDQQPALSKDGLSLYFASGRPEREDDRVLDQNIWVAQRSCTGDPEDCPWGDPVAVPFVNTGVLDVSPTLSRDGHQLFLSSQRPHNHCSAPPCTNRDLWVSYRENVHDDFHWGEAVNLGDNINSVGEEVGPSYFENTETGVPQLFFNRGAVGGDIFVSELRDGAWQSPDEVEELNTSGTDQRPSISQDGLEIYFFSDRDPDAVNRLWIARRQSVSSTWSAPVRLEFPTSEQEAIMPFIHSHGRTETLLFVRPFAL